MRPYVLNVYRSLRDYLSCAEHRDSLPFCPDAFCRIEELALELDLGQGERIDLEGAAESLARQRGSQVVEATDVDQARWGFELSR